jgi:hypothetical protein
VTRHLNGFWRVLAGRGCRCSGLALLAACGSVLQAEPADLALGRGVFGTRLERKADGRVDWDRTREARPARDEGRVSLRVSPMMALPPAGAQITVVVRRDPRNRRLRVEIDCEGFYQSFEEDLSAQNRAQFVSLVRRLPAGECAATATLSSADGAHATSSVSFRRGAPPVEGEQ